jgi:hypothetical protein
MKTYDLTQSPIDKLIDLMEDAWFWGCLTVPDKGGYDEDLNDG